MEIRKPVQTSTNILLLLKMIVDQRYEERKWIQRNNPIFVLIWRGFCAYTRWPSKFGWFKELESEQQFAFIERVFSLLKNGAMVVSKVL